MIRRVKIPTITTAGANGSAAGNGQTPAPIEGRILAIHVNYTSQPATTDVTFTTVESPVQTILTLTDINTDGFYYPRVAVHDTAGVAATLDGTRAMRDTVPVADYVKATVAQGDAAGTLDVTVWYEA